MSEPDAMMFGGDGFGPLLERVVTGEVVTILFHGLAVLSFDGNDPIARDLVVHSLLRVALKGKTVAAICGVSPAHVSGVGRRVEEGGLAALANRGTGGGQFTILGAALKRLKAMHTQGASLGKIARAIGHPKTTVNAAVQRLKAGIVQRDAQPALTLGVAEVAIAESTAAEWIETASHDDEERACGPHGDGPELAWEEEDLEPGVWLEEGPIERETRYAGTLLLCAAAGAIGVHDAIAASSVVRPEKSRYAADQALMAWSAAWTSGMGSLEAMHERDAAALGVVLGMERSPSVRTLHRALGQMVRAYDPSAWNVALMRGVAHAFGPNEVRLFGVDGHIKPYKGDAPIDKGWDSKRRLASKALAEVRVSDDQGVTWWHFDVGAGDALSKHLLHAGSAMREVLGTEQPIVLAFDRGGFDFTVLAHLDREGFYYVAYVPASVRMPDLHAIAPSSDGVGDIVWTHPSLTHPSRLVVERDGGTCIPMTTNLPTLVDAASTVELLRSARGWQENGIKAARAFAHIDRLVDRGGARYAPDDRRVRNPAHAVQRAAKQRALDGAEALSKLRPTRGQRTLAEIEGRELLAGLRVAIEAKKLADIPEKVPRITLEPHALRAWLKTKNRALLSPLKHANDNARRWLLEVLGSALAPTDHEYDTSARSRTLVALLRAPGTVRFQHGRVVVTLRLNLPPTAHSRVASALQSLDSRALLFTDGTRNVIFRLAPRTQRRDLDPRRERLASAQPTGGNSN